jgi:hypothetical protein
MNRSENLTIQLTRQLEQDPDEIFSGAMSCSLSEGNISKLPYEE